MIANIIWIFKWFRGSIMSVPGRMISLVFFLFLVIFPLITTDLSMLRIITIAAIFALFSSSWDFLSGFTGQINLGHALFFGVAAYCSAIFNKYLGLPPWISIPIGSFSAVIVGLIVGIPALRLRGFYLGLVTFAFPVILSGVIFIFADFTGGEQGLYGLDRLSSSRLFDYYIVVSIMIISLLIMYKLTDSRSKIVRTGLPLRGIREDEITARASGINTTRYKLMAFAISGFFAGIAGALFAHYMRIAGPTTLEIFLSIEAILWTVFGGIATIYGSVVGVFILYPIMEILRFWEFGENIRFILFSIILILTLIFMPEGISVWVRDKIEVTCQRCKIVNVFTRRYCRACRAPLHLEKDKNL